MSRRGSKSTKRDDGDALLGDEIDAFTRGRDKIALSDQHQDEDFEDDEEEDVLALDVDDQDGEDDEEEGEEVEEEEEEEVPKEKEDLRVGGWGDSRYEYYDVHRAGEDDLLQKMMTDKEDMEEEEAKRIQKSRAVKLRPEDFVQGAKDEEDLLANAKGSSAEGTAVHGLEHDLREISLGGGKKGPEESVEKNVAALSKEEKIRIVSKNSPELIGLLVDFKQKTVELREHLQPVLAKIKDAKQAPETSAGVTFLELKYQLLLHYCTNVAFYLMLKARGVSVKDHPVIGELVRLRVTLEKMKPIERRLRYQIDKLLKTAATGTVSTTDPLNFKPNLAGLRGDEDGGAAAEEQEEEEKKSKGGVYKPPKLREVHYEGTTLDDKRKADAVRKAKRASKNAITSYIRAEFGDAPEEEAVVGAGLMTNPNEDDVDPSEAARMRDREEYEEDHFMRMDETREEKKRKNKAPQLVDELKEMDKFTEIARIHRKGGDSTAAAGDDSDDDELGGEMDQRRRKQLSQALNTIGQDNTFDAARKKRLRSADMDVPVKQPMLKRREQSTLDNEEIDSDEASGNEGKNDAKKIAAQQRKQERFNKHKETIQKKAKAADDRRTVKPGEKRGINRRIENNRGLQRERSASDFKGATPHARVRAKFEKKERLHKSQMPAQRDKSKPFTGESSGIKPRVVRSTKI